MEQKITDTMHSMGVILSQYYTRSDQRLYALTRLDIDIPKVHHTLRKSRLTKIDRENLILLLSELERYAAYYEVDGHSRYYIQLFMTRVSEILNE